jgi:hypothetical protein
MTDEKDAPQGATDGPASATPAAEAPAVPGRYADLDLLQDEVARRIRDNQRFLDHLLDDDYSDEEESEEAEGDSADFEEL